MPCFDAASSRVELGLKASKVYDAYSYVPRYRNAFIANVYVYVLAAAGDACRSA
jgi:hypothetical protein